jgi:hypothetical protein
MHKIEKPTKKDKGMEKRQESRRHLQREGNEGRAKVLRSREGKGQICKDLPW